MQGPEEVWFDHERLEVYREAIVFNAWVSALLDAAVGGSARSKTNWIAHRHPSRSTSPRETGNTRLKTAADSLTSPTARRWNAPPAWTSWSQNRRPRPIKSVRAKRALQRIVRMLIGLIKRNSTRDYDKPSPKS